MKIHIETSSGSIEAERNGQNIRIITKAGPQTAIAMVSQIEWKRFCEAGKALLS